MAYEMRKQQGGDTSALATKTAGIVSQYLTKNRDAIIASLPHGFKFDRMCRTAINAISTTPTIARCDAGSLFLSIVKAFALGLEPNGALAEGYLVPFWNSKKGINEAQFMPSYRGFIQLARRSGKIADIYAKAVYSNDVFEVEEGTERKIVHKPDYTKTRGDAVCYYAVFHTTDGAVDFEVMSRDEIERVRSASKAKDAGPWKEWYEEMAKKTVLKRLLKRAPMSIELSDAIELENKASMGEAQADNTLLNMEGLEIPDEDATPAEVQKEINSERAAELKDKIAGAKSATPATESGERLI